MDVEARLIPDGFQVPYASTAVNIRVIEQGMVNRARAS